MNGQLMNILMNERMEPGSYTTIWDGTSAEGLNLPNGKYLGVMIQNNVKIVTKSILISR